MNRDDIHIGDHILVDEHIYVVIRKHNESAFCQNVDTGYKAHIDYSDMEAVKLSVIHPNTLGAK